jgi:2-iminobutanoate/2-iminopropanoate deaminase
MVPGDIVKVNTSLLDAAHRAEYARVRAEVLGDLRPAFMLSVVSELIRPDILVEVEVIAAAP